MKFLLEHRPIYDRYGSGTIKTFDGDSVYRILLDSCTRCNYILVFVHNLGDIFTSRPHLFNDLNQSEEQI